MSNKYIYLSEIDVEILYALARGRDLKGIATLVGITYERVRGRTFNLRGIFGAMTHAHLVAIAIASDIIYVPELHDESLADAIMIHSDGAKRERETNRPWHLLSKQLEIKESVLT